MTPISGFPTQHNTLLPKITFMLYTKPRGHYFAWVKEVLRESKPNLCFGFMGRGSKLETKRDHYLKMEVHMMKCKGEAERKKG